MKYNYREGIEKRKSRKRFIFPMFLVLGGLYAVVTYLAPEILYVVDSPDATAKKLVSERPVQGQERLYIPKLNTDVAIVAEDVMESVDTAAQEQSLVSGNPNEGGNYVLAANRFSIGFTPTATKAKSPFYHVGKLSSGDDVYLDYKGVRYAYKVEEIKVAENITQYESRTDEPRLTLYTSEAAGRQVITAKQTGKIVWTSGQPKLQPLPDS
jgi:sortase A